MYKRIALIIISITISLIGFSQQIKKVDGFFLDEKGQKYNGELTSFFENGNKEFVYKINEGVEDGKVVFYHQSGKTMEEGFYKNGLKSGKWVKWSEEGNKLAEANYNEGVKHGSWLVWDENGINRYEMEYNNGNRTGTWISRNETGEVVSNKTY
jgi:antitoxin component YwqK of YwqJK toxin-antitoxin module